MDELQAFVELNNAGMVCIVESWLNPSNPAAAINLSGFCCFSLDRDYPDGRSDVCVLCLPPAEGI